MPSPVRFPKDWMNDDSVTSTQLWRVVLSNICPYCYAPPRHNCKTSRGVVRLKPHHVRFAVARDWHPGVMLIEEEPW